MKLPFAFPTRALVLAFTVAVGCQDVKLETSPSNNGEAVFSNVSFPAGQIVSKTVNSWSEPQ